MSAGRIETNDGCADGYSESPRRLGIHQMILRGNKNQHLRFHVLGKLLERNSEFRGKIEGDNGLPLADLIAGYAGTTLGILFYAADKGFEAPGIRMGHAII